MLKEWRLGNPLGRAFRKLKGKCEKGKEKSPENKKLSREPLRLGTATITGRFSESEGETN